MTSTPISGASLPNFDEDWRTREAAARALELRFLDLILKLNPDSIETISTAFTRLAEQHKKSRILNEKINSAYKRSKREIEAQKEAVKTKNVFRRRSRS